MNDSCSEYIPLQSDEPDGWPRVRNGDKWQLVKPGDAVWDEYGREHRLICSDRDIAADVQGVKELSQQRVRLDDLHAIKPGPPVTLESALRAFVNAFEFGWSDTGMSRCVPKPRADELLADAKRALSENAEATNTENLVRIQGNGMDFLIGRYPVTVEEYGRYLSSTGCEPPSDWDEQSKHPRRPVVRVNWHEATAYAKWAKCRLPTEQEWEFAASGAEGRAYPWGNDAPNEDRCNFGNNVGRPTDVDSYPAGATPEGVMDLAGNVWEWCQDKYRPGSSGRVLRGGSWNDNPRDCRSAIRNVNGPDNRYFINGFRVARTYT